MKYKTLALIIALLVPNMMFASSGDQKLLKRDWPFEGNLGKFDQQSIQRGFQIYQEVCSGCHSLKRVYYRNLTEVGFSAAEAKVIAAGSTVMDGPNDEGDMFERSALLSDHFVSPFVNAIQARASNGGALPPDLSLIIKSRLDGANYLYSLLNGYMETPRDLKMGANMSFNIFFPGYQIAMQQPLSPDQVEYQDGTKASVEQMSYDVVNFLQWAAEPEMEQRKKMGLKVLLFLFVTTLLFFVAKKRIWSDVK